MLFKEGINWNDYPVKIKRGIVVCKESYDKSGFDNKGKLVTAVRTRWAVKDTPIFTEDTGFLYNLIPKVD